MATINFANLKQNSNSASSNGGVAGPRFFNKLKNDGDEIIVRFIENSADTFEINTIHPGVPINGSFRDVSCARDINDPVEKCPLCAAKQADGKSFRVVQKISVKMLVYEQDETGKIIAVPMVWSRPTSFAYELNEYIENYGPLEDVICKVIRHGARGDMQTTYQVVPNLNKNIYRDDVYVKDTSAFTNFKALGRMIINRSAEDMQVYLATGNFPMPNNQATQSATTPTPTYIPQEQPPIPTQPVAPVETPMTVPSTTPTPNPYMMATPTTGTAPTSFAPPTTSSPAKPQFTPNPNTGTQSFPWMNNGGNTVKFGGR